MNLRNRKIEVKLSLTAGTLLILITGLLLLAYSFWEVYWFSQQGWFFVKWHTHLVPYIFLYLILFSGLHVGMWAASRVFSVVLNTVSVLFGLEVLLLLFTPFPDHELLNQFKVYPENYYHVSDSNLVYHLTRPEFSFPRQANSLGFPDDEWTVEKQTPIRIISLGDSFTEGDGAPADSAYPQILENILNEGKSFRTYEVLNAGTCGSDPLFNLVNLQDRLLQYKPDVVLQTISSHDLLKDIAVRGGFERFNPNGTLNLKPMPLWVYPAVLSRIARVVLMKLNVYESQPVSISEEFLAELELIQQQLVSRYDSLAQANQFTVYIIAFPLQWESKFFAYRYDFSILKQMVEKTSSLRYVDLMPCYEAYSTSSGLPTSSWYWEKDAHHNPEGYTVMARCVADNLDLPSKLGITESGDSTVSQPPLLSP